jgi:hypothetical protein
MLWKLFVVATLLWLIGMAVSFTLHGFIHILLGVAGVLFALLINQDRKSLTKLHSVHGRVRWRS